MSRLEELRGAAEKATPGKWGMLPGGPGKMNAIYKDTPASGALAYVGAEWTDAAADAEFIVHANPETVLALIALVKELSAALDLLLERVEPYGIGTADFGPCFAYKFARDGASAALASAATWMED